MNNLLAIIFIVFFSTNIFAENILDQWKDSNKTYKDLINEGYEVKSYDTTTIESDRGLIILLFITVLQRKNEIFECQEYQTLDRSMNTLDISMICRELTQPYNLGVKT